MTQLLISVRSAEEAAIAVRGGADWIDVKEPSRGSLGAADVSIQREVVAAVNGERPVSAALGELIEQSGSDSLAPGVAFAKVGLARAADCSDWRERWRQWADALPAAVHPVAVAYAVKLVRSPSSVKEDFVNPLTLGFCGALPVGMSLVAGGIGPYAPQAGSCLWWLSFALLLGFQAWGLLRLLSGIYEPTRGVATVTGRVAPIFDLGVGMDPEISGFENIVIRGLFLGQTRKQMLAKVDEIAEFTELGMIEKLGCPNPADLAVMYTEFYKLQVEPYIQDAIRFLELTTEGKQWIANLDSNLFQAGHRPCRIGPFPGNTAS